MNEEKVDEINKKDVLKNILANKKRFYTMDKVIFKIKKR
jgi:hypothetical protein